MTVRTACFPNGPAVNPCGLDPRGGAGGACSAGSFPAPFKEGRMSDIHRRAPFRPRGRTSRGVPGGVSGPGVPGCGPAVQAMARLPAGEG
ncbi:hypothetical protein M0638_08315 [Roseomonas sp. NAR14]|uniref:3-dehydroquinate dehydratase n=1 Tax=Roseomonas acroporae TaxID=2937791 RepID=A0A9X2BWX9_9PROT|nr:hypothetical protein [Roseomonas acroporae]MCK8784380.1 hypothetical protein [Roseomonas acroporae]